MGASALGDAIIFILHAGWVVCAVVAVLKWRESGDVGDAPPISLAQAQPGKRGCIQGLTAFVGGERLSTLRKVPAVWHAWQVERRQPRQPTAGTDEDRWYSEEGGSSEEPFALEDGAGNRVVVAPQRAKLDGLASDTWFSPVPRTGGALGAGIEVIATLAGTGGYRFTEHRLEPGVPCFVVGRLEPPRPEDGPGVRGFVTGMLGQPIHIATGTPAQAQSTMRTSAIVWTMVAGGLLVVALAVTLDRLGFG